MRGLGISLHLFGLVTIFGVVVGSVTSGLPPVDVALMVGVFFIALPFGLGSYLIRRGGGASYKPTSEADPNP